MMKTMRFLVAVLSIFWMATSCQTGTSPVPDRVSLDFDWRFALSDYPGAEQPAVDDSEWRQLDVPHDFSIEQPFDSTNATGAGGGYTYSGVGWYRKTFRTESDWAEKQISVLFDGVYRNSEVWINGQYLGIWPYGYSSFHYDLTPHLKPAGEENVLAVRVNTTHQPNSRWYTGAGIYRHVWLVAKNKWHINQWGVFARTASADLEKATIDVSIEMNNASDQDHTGSLVTRLMDAEGREAASTTAELSLAKGQQQTVAQVLHVNQPSLWSVDQPSLYRLVVEVRQGTRVVDSQELPFGIRTFRFDADSGFFLNEKQIKLKGVNNHHDGGPLGAAVLDHTHSRQLQILKGMGCNALRMSHNPPSPELLYYADSMGFLVIDEIFDEWVDGKTPGGYAPHFAEWHEKDVKNWIRRDRNHPSVIAWSIGNEVREQYNKENALQITQRLMAAASAHDQTRPFTAACNEIVNANNFGMADLLDIVGYNYQEAFYQKDHQQYPNRVIYGSETVMYPYHPGDCWQLRSYEQWLEGQLSNYVAGEFLWTGFDYIGEAGIGEVGSGCEFWKIWPSWPSRGASCGVIDMCGFPKPGYWFRKALWNSEPMVYLAVQTDTSARNREVCSFWSWPKVESHWNHRQPGDTLAVHVYTNVPDVELILNGQSLGARRWDIREEAFLFWEVPFEPGKLEARGKSADGKTVTYAVQTAGAPANIALTPDKSVLQANGQDLTYITVQVLDANGVPVPFQDKEIQFIVTGAGKLAAVGNGNQKSHTPLKGNVMETWLGRCLAIVQSGKQPGEIVIEAKSSGLPSTSLILNVE